MIKILIQDLPQYHLKTNGANSGAVSVKEVVGMVSHKMSMITIFDLKYFMFRNSFFTKTFFDIESYLDFGIKNCCF